MSAFKVQRHKIIMSFEEKGTKVSLLDQGNGFLCIEYTRRGQKKKSAGVYDATTQLREAVATYHGYVSKVQQEGPPRE